MEISDQRYHELVASMARGRRGNDYARLTARVSPLLREVATHIMVKQNRQRAQLVTSVAHVAGGVKEILIVDPDAETLRAARNALQPVADVEACSEFWAARTRLVSRPPDLLVTNVRLEGYNGLHLVHLAARTPTRCIVYARHDDLVLAREVQAAGAFYERSDRLPRALESYVHALLPAHDRRSLTVLDRRQAVRGGRRCTDHYYQPD
jgi:CheY-like chemotaxis protein